MLCAEIGDTPEVRRVVGRTHLKERHEAQKVYYCVTDTWLVDLVLRSESLMEELLLCTREEATHAGKED